MVVAAVDPPEDGQRPPRAAFASLDLGPSPSFVRQTSAPTGFGDDAGFVRQTSAPNGFGDGKAAGSPSFGPRQTSEGAGFRRQTSDTSFARQASGTKSQLYALIDQFLPAELEPSLGLIGYPEQEEDFGGETEFELVCSTPPPTSPLANPISSPFKHGSSPPRGLCPLSPMMMPPAAKPEADNGWSLNISNNNGPQRPPRRSTSTNDMQALAAAVAEKDPLHHLASTEEEDPVTMQKESLLVEQKKRQSPFMPGKKSPSSPYVGFLRHAPPASPSMSPMLLGSGCPGGGFVLPPSTQSGERSPSRQSPFGSLRSPFVRQTSAGAVLGGGYSANGGPGEKQHTPENVARQPTDGGEEVTLMMMSSGEKRERVFSSVGSPSEPLVQGRQKQQRQQGFQLREALLKDIDAIEDIDAQLEKHQKAAWSPFQSLLNSMKVRKGAALRGLPGDLPEDLWQRVLAMTITEPSGGQRGPGEVRKIAAVCRALNHLLHLPESWEGLAVTLGAVAPESVETIMKKWGHVWSRVAVARLPSVLAEGSLGAMLKREGVVVEKIWSFQQPDDQPSYERQTSGGVRVQPGGASAEKLTKKELKKQQEEAGAETNDEEDTRLVVIGDCPLLKDYFELRIEARASDSDDETADDYAIDDEVNDMGIGFTTCSPEEIRENQDDEDQPPYLVADEVPNSWVLDFSKSCVMLSVNNENMPVISETPGGGFDMLKKGTVVGVGVTEDRMGVTLFLNKKEMITLRVDEPSKKIPDDVPLYPVFDLYGRTLKVTALPTVSSPAQQPIKLSAHTSAEEAIAGA